MTLTALRYVIAVATLKHFGKAAKSCHVSQPTLSIAISKLEKELNVTIFERHNSAIRITEVGQILIAQAQHVLEEADKLKNLSRDAQSQLTEPLKIGAIYTVSPYLYPKIIPKITKLAPQMPLVVEENFTHVLKEKLLTGELDAIFIALPFDGSGIITRSLYEEPFVVLMRKDHPLSQHKTIDAAALKKETILLLGESHCFRTQVLKVCPNCDTRTGLQNTVEGTSLETLRHMVVAGMGITILPSSATQIQYYDQYACTRPFAGHPPQRHIALAWRASFPRPKAIETLIRAMKKSMLSGICLIPQ